MTKIAIITRTKNRPRLLARAVQSVLDQTCSDWHHIIVNDAGDGPEVERVISAYQERYQGRLTLLHRTQSTGMEAASNAGIAASSSEFIAIHDDDDRWEPLFLQKCCDYLERHQSVTSLGGVVTHIKRVTERIEAERIVELKHDIMNRWLRHVTLVDAVSVFCWVPIGFVYRRSALEAVGPYREDLPVLGDFDFNVRFLRRWDIGVIPEPLACYHVRDVTHTTGFDRNSVTSQDELFSLHLSRLQNQWLREDLDAGRFGMGSLVNICKSLDHIQRNTLPMGRAFDKLLSMRSIAWLLRKMGFVRN